MKTHWTRWILVPLAALVFSFQALAQYPTKPIKVIVPYPPGGGSDTIARLMTQHMSQTLGQPFVLDFKPGADTQIGSSELTRAAPDGYTLLLGNAAGLSYVPAMRKVQPYDAVRDFTPVSAVVMSTFGVFVHPGVPARSLRELMTYARANPGRLNYGTPTGSAVLLAAMLLKETNTEMVQIPFKGDAPALTELLSGRVHMVISAPGAFTPHIKDGKLRALALTSAQRSMTLPDVPTFTEAGFAPPRVKSWIGLFGPAGMPKEIAERLSRAVQGAMAREDVRKQLDALGFVAGGSSPDELGAMVKDQLEVWRSAVAQAGLAPE